ncbi:prolyl oligopeptidase family serine peptidase [Chitinophaga filiformis]|uniref:alpha/beta hydrolase family protein n=1 Tax=Chitinophaga filiformis TaxID=104663 RepID=UPI001F31DD95|nr:prolyl oligopeptidase family serine peptidase [Chitinophaga filiformis]MCF6401330.1 prolyl oligopeptidase family serine peptidase [Chitinophaga filiformis]
MKKIIFCIIFLTSLNAIAQKIIDDDAMIHWPVVNSEYGISGNGKYVYYTVSEMKYDSSCLFICNNNGKVIRKFYHAGNPTFSPHSDYIYFQGRENKLYSLDIVRNVLDSTECIKEYKSIDLGGDEIVVLKSCDNILSVKNVTERSKLTLSKCTRTIFCSNESYMIAQLNDKQKGLAIIDLGKLTYKLVITDTVLDFNINKNGTYCAYLSESVIDGNSQLAMHLYDVKKGLDTIVLKSDSKLLGKKYVIKRSGSNIEFNSEGNLLFLSITSIPLVPKASDDFKLDIWNYRDKILTPELNRNLRANNEFLVYCYNIRYQKNIVLNDSLVLAGNHLACRRYLLIDEKRNSPWFDEYEDSIKLKLLDLNTNIAIPLRLGLKRSIQDVTISPTEGFVLWFDFDANAWFSYNIKSRIVKNITESCSAEFRQLHARKRGRLGNWGIAAWGHEDEFLLLYDEFDIWKVSLDKSFSPQEISWGWGKKSGLTLNILSIQQKSLKHNDYLLISGYNHKTKKGRYWFKRLDMMLDIDTSHLENYSVATRWPLGIFGQPEGKIIKAKEKNVFVVLRENSTSSKNISLTKNLINYQPISNCHPENEYNWYRTQLFTYKLASGVEAQGVLYIPNSLNEEKKYPIILNYYEIKSDEINKFQLPDYSRHNINIPLFVQEGFLVFIPDIISEQGENGKGTYNSVMAGIEAIKHLPYLDTTRMAIQGHSYGGWQTNYLITHTQVFKAAVAAAGVADLVSSYGQLIYNNGGTRQSHYELSSQGSAYGFGVTPWTNPELYIKNSPIFNIGRITTPLLMMHNSDDSQVPFEQAIEMFTAMRRAGKRVWLLQYEGNYNHILSGKAAIDYHNKMLSFFKLYLNGDKMPEWMSKTNAELIAISPNCGLE